MNRLNNIMLNIFNGNIFRITVRRAIIVLFIILAAMLQNSANGLFAKTDAGIFLLIPLCVSISMFEKEFAGMFFGILAGALWDLSSPVTDGVFALFFGLVAFTCGLLSHYIFRNSLKTAAVFTFFATLLFCGVSLIFNCLIKDFCGAEYYIKSFCIPSAAITFILFPVSYYSVKLTEKIFRNKDNTLQLYDN